jgi:hypothetical protein
MAKRKRYAPEDPEDAAAPDPEQAPAWEHAECQSCGAAVTYEPTPSGVGFMVMRQSGVDPEATFGVGEHGRPRCPHGHGEMGIAEAGPLEQPALFDIAKPFNFEGAYLEVEGLTVEVDRLAGIAEEDKRTAASSRDQWAEAAKRLHTLTLELRRRRLAKRDRERQAPLDASVAPASAADSEMHTTAEALR